MRRASCFVQLSRRCLTRCDKPKQGGRGGGVIAADAQASAALDKIMGRWDNIDNRVATAVARKRGKVVPKVA